MNLLRAAAPGLLALALSACTPPGMTGAPLPDNDAGPAGPGERDPCGDEVCAGDESCESCARDCGFCEGACNDNGACEVGETCANCGDCGACEEPAPCERFASLVSGDTIVISGDMGDDRDKAGFGCDVHGHFNGEVTNVTVTGSWTGDLRCRKCNGWTFENLVVSQGSLRMIGGEGWTIRDSRFDGGGRGVMAVVGTGSVDDAPYATPVGWTIENIEATNAGCRPVDDPYPTHVRALYLIGHNGVSNQAVVRGSVFRGEACGVTVKIGGTGNFGAGPTSPDAADGVLFENNEVFNTDEGDRREEGSYALLVATNSDDVVLRGNAFSALDRALTVSGPFTGQGLVVEDNIIDAPKFMLGRIYTNAFGGEGFVNYDEPGACPEVGSCRNNVRAGE